MRPRQYSLSLNAGSFLGTEGITYSPQNSSVFSNALLSSSQPDSL